MRLRYRSRRLDVGHSVLLIDELTRGLPRRFSRGGPRKVNLSIGTKSQLEDRGLPILLKETRLEKSEHRGFSSRRVGHHHACVRRMVALAAGDCGHRCVPHPVARVRGVYLWLRAYRSDRVSRTDIRSGRAGDRGGRSRQRVRAGQMGQRRGRLIGPGLTAGGLVRGLAVDSAAALRGLSDLGGESRHDWPVHGERLSYQGPERRAVLRGGRARLYLLAFGRPDLGFIPALSDCLASLKLEPWLGGALARAERPSAAVAPNSSATI